MATSRNHAQLALELPIKNGHGGRRAGAGRKPGPRPLGRVRRRAYLERTTPVHVTMRTVDGLSSLRRRDGYRAMRWALCTALKRADFRVCHLSIQGDHVHLIAEAASATALARGMQGLQIAAAKRLNRMRGRKGQVFRTRYHAVQMRHPRQVRSGLAYVLNNWRRHRVDRVLGAQRGGVAIDPYSSGAAFEGWKAPRFTRLRPDEEILPVSFATTWLLDVGWRRHGRIDRGEVPGSR